MPTRLSHWVLGVAIVLLAGAACLVLIARQGGTKLEGKHPPAPGKTNDSGLGGSSTEIKEISPNSLSADQSGDVEKKYHKIVNELVGDERIKALMRLGWEQTESGSIEDLLWLAGNMESGSAKEMLLAHMPARLLAHDRTRALDWLMALPREAESVCAFSGFGKAYADIDPAEAFAFGKTISWKAARENYIDNFIDSLASKGIDNAWTWIHTLVLTDPSGADLLKESAIMMARYAK